MKGFLKAFAAVVVTLVVAFVAVLVWLMVSISYQR